MADTLRRAPDIFASAKETRVLDEDAEARKRGIYESLGRRGKKYVDAIGYDAWDPFQEPKEPLDIRTDATRRTTRQLVNRFLQDREAVGGFGNAYGQGVLECALGIVNKDEKFRGIFEFCLWYARLLQEEGRADERTL
jgi:formamidopyrimidine-DNA glycosylase